MAQLPFILLSVISASFASQWFNLLSRMSADGT